MGHGADGHIYLLLGAGWMVRGGGGVVGGG